MVVIRNVFRLKFGKAREAVALFKEGIAIQKRVGAGSDFSTRLLTDVTGPFYTVVLEITVPNLAAFEGTRPDSWGTKTGKPTIRRSRHWWSLGLAKSSRSWNKGIWRNENGRTGMGDLVTECRRWLRPGSAFVEGGRPFLRSPYDAIARDPLRGAIRESAPYR
jgi:hypothetical protein